MAEEEEEEEGEGDIRRVAGVAAGDFLELLRVGLLGLHRGVLTNLYFGLLCPSPYVSRQLVGLMQVCGLMTARTEYL